MPKKERKERRDDLSNCAFAGSCLLLKIASCCTMSHFRIVFLLMYVSLWIGSDYCESCRIPIHSRLVVLYAIFVAGIFFLLPPVRFFFLSQIFWLPICL